MPGSELELAPLRQSPGVEDGSPVRVGPAGDADPDPGGHAPSAARRPRSDRRRRARPPPWRPSRYLAGVARPDVGLEDQRDPAAVPADHLAGAFDDRHAFVPVALEGGEHRVGPVGQTGFPDDPDRLGHRNRDRAGLIRCRTARRHRTGQRRTRSAWHHRIGAMDRRERQELQVPVHPPQGFAPARRATPRSSGSGVTGCGLVRNPGSGQLKGWAAMQMWILRGVAVTGASAPRPGGHVVSPPCDPPRDEGRRLPALDARRADR